MRIRSWLSRICLLGAAALTVTALVAPPVTAADPPATFQATGFASAIQAMVNTNPQTFVADLVRMDVPHGQAAFGSGGQSNARAASMFPGVGASEGPALGWGQACSRGFPCAEFFPEGGFPPPWPLGTEAENPTRTESKPTVEGQQIGEVGGPISFTLVDVEATATAEIASTKAVISDLNLFPVDAFTPGANPSAVHVGGLTATTHLRVEDGVIVAEAESRLDDVSLFGGAIEIDTIITRSVSTADADGMLANAPEVTIKGATAGGQPITITNEGIVAGGNAVDQGGIPTLSTGVGKLFNAGPLSVRLISATDDVREGTARGSAVGLAVHVEINASGFPSGSTLVGDLILGTAATTAFADGDALGEDDITLDDAFGFDDSFVATDEFGGDGFSTGEVTEVLGESTESGDAGGTSEQAADLTTAGGETVTRLAPLEALLQGAAADRIKLLYLAWTLALIGLALGSRFHPFRLAARGESAR